MKATPGKPSGSRPGPTVLTLNGGSSSIKFALFEIGEEAELGLQGLHGKVEWSHAKGASLRFTDPSRDPREGRLAQTFEREAATSTLLDWLEEQPAFATVRAVGHRLVHGMGHREPERATEELLEELERSAPRDPEHMPLELELFRTLARRRPELPQVVCFDTAFHRNLPRVARLLPIPRRYQELGIERYGFHGLSYTSQLETLRQLGDPAATNGRVILAHLGNGASLAAVRDGKSIDTSMAFTPAAGLPMGTRSGDLDPGLVDHLARTEGMTSAAFAHMVNHESGLLGVSGGHSDMRELLEREATDEGARDALALFCYQVKKWIGAFAAALGGLDTLVFAGGIGEHAPAVRSRACAGLGFLGIELEEGRNAASEGVISSVGSRVTVRVLRADEERMIAKAVMHVLGLPSKQRSPS